MDGYPSGHGKELAEFLKPITIVNGFSGGMKEGTHANGAGCLAAQLIKHFKKDIGGIYIEQPNCKDAGQEYEYHITVNDGQITVTVKSSSYDQSCKKIIFKGKSINI
ncbi:MAG: hypothetical protein HC880_14895 [Bacteroidia bacterium]|nr:hypothetical protein [Bacteroidia bacterium]